MTLSFDLFWSFRSPYSYLATARIVSLRDEYDLQVNLRPVYPIAIRNEEFFASVNPLWPGYLLRDTVRIAERLGMAYHWPRPDPVYRDPETRRYPKEQPFIHRLTRLGVEAHQLGRGLEFIDEVSKTLFGGTENWHKGDHLSDAAKRAGLDLAAMDKAIEADAGEYEAVIEANQQALHDAGHWGVPTMVFEGEPFFGQDRIEDLIWRLERNGLARR